MKFIVSRSALALSVSVVSKGIATNAIKPILSGVLLKCSDGILELQTTDLTISIRHKVAADVIEEGSTVISGRILQNIVKTLPDAAVTFESQSHGSSSSVLITCERSTFRLNCLSPDEFPEFPEFEFERSIELPSDMLAQMISKVYRVTSKDNSRPILQGVQLTIEDSTVRLVATDSYRLAVCDTQITTQAQTESFSLIVPGNIFHEVLRTPSMTEKILIAKTDNQVIFTFGNSTVISRLIEGTYPNYRQLISDNYSTSVRVSTDVFAAALKRVSVIATANPSIRFQVDPDSSTLTLSASAPDQGDSMETIGIEVQGDPVVIGLNHRFVSDCINAIAGTDTVSFELSGSMRPAIFKSTGQINYLYLLMPVRL